MSTVVTRSSRGRSRTAARHLLSLPTTNGIPSATSSSSASASHSLSPHTVSSASTRALTTLGPSHGARLSSLPSAPSASVAWNSSSSSLASTPAQGLAAGMYALRSHVARPLVASGSHATPVRGITTRVSSALVRPTRTRAKHASSLATRAMSSVPGNGGGGDDDDDESQATKRPRSTKVDASDLHVIHDDDDDDDDESDDEHSDDDDSDDEDDQDGVKKGKDKASKHKEGAEGEDDGKDNASLANPSFVVPDSAPVVPIYKRHVFPGIVAPVVITDDKLVDQLDVNSTAALFLVTNDELTADPAPGEARPVIRNYDDLADEGVLVRILGIQRSKIGSQVLVAGITRVQKTGLHAGNTKPRMEVTLEAIKDSKYDKERPEIKAYTVEIVHTLKELVKLNPFFKEQLSVVLERVDLSNPSELADLAAAMTTANPEQLQEVIAARNIPERLSKALFLLKSELDVSKVQQKISRELEDKVSTTQRKYMLNEQLKAIKKELGLETDEKEALLTKFRGRLETLEVPQEVMGTIEEEMAKLGSLEPNSSEFGVTRNYLDWLTQLPWGVYSQDRYDLDYAQGVLDDDHYGLKDIKERILEYIAVGKLVGTVQGGKIICLVGPPGVGKTSIGKSIARALDRKFFRFSVGGMTDVSEIKGHRRTYVGAMPGKLIQSLKTVSTSNPVVMIDEIDKLGRSIQGDPGSALLEVLDKEQNDKFLDHYLDVPVDLSKVLFLCTANVMDTIPAWLQDRMEVLRLSGYVLEEKVHIAKQYLIPLARKEVGLKAKQVTIRSTALSKLISDYCREAGVRKLNQMVERIFRKAAYMVARGEEEQVVVTAANLEEFVGKPIWTSDRYYKKSMTGVVMGLAWTSMGGATLYIETVPTPTPTAPRRRKKGNKKRNDLVEDNDVLDNDIRVNSDNNDDDDYDDDDDDRKRTQATGRLMTTGQMGDVMKESTSIAYTVAKRFLYNLDPNNDFLHTATLHMHLPEGAQPKDGPSAGVTMVTSLLSLALDKAPRENLAMTGEVTLTGKVLPIGGVKEKLIASRRSGVKVVIFPEGNRKDVDELEDYLKEGMEIHFADWIDDVVRVAGLID